MKKLSKHRSVKLTQTLGGQREILREHTNKINEIIDFLEPKTEGRLCKHKFPSWRMYCGHICSPKQDTWESELLKKIKYYDSLSKSSILVEDYQNAFARILVDFIRSELQNQRQEIKEIVKQRTLAKDPVKEILKKLDELDK